MFGLPIFQKPKPKNKFLTLEINSTEVRALAFYMQDNLLKIIGSGEARLTENDVRAGNIIDKDNVSRAVAEACDMACEELEENLEDVLVSVEGDLCLGITTTARADRPERTIIEQEEVDAIYDRITEAAYIQAQNEYLQITGNASENFDIITTSNVYFKVDEKDVEDPLKFEGTTLEVANFNAFTPSFHIKNIKTLTKKNKLNLITLGSNLYTIVQTLKGAEPKEQDFVVINVGTDLTNVGVVFGGGIVATKTLNMGYSHFIEGLNNKMGLTAKESQRVLESYCAGQLTESEGTIVQKCIKDVLEIWMLGIELLFEEFTEIKTFSSQIYVVGKGSTIPDLMTYLKEKPWFKSIPFKSLPQTSKLEMTDLSSISDATNKINSSGWLPLASLAVIYLEMFGGEQSLNDQS